MGMGYKSVDKQLYLLSCVSAGKPWPLELGSCGHHLTVPIRMGQRSSEEAACWSSYYTVVSGGVGSGTSGTEADPHAHQGRH